MIDSLSASNVQRMTLPLSALKPHPLNYNEHPEEEIAGLIESYETLGQFRAFTIIEDPDEKGTYFTVTSNGITDAMRQVDATEAFCDVLPPDTPHETIIAIMVADNEHQRKSRANVLKLTELLQTAESAGVSLEAMGSSEDDLQALLEAEANKLLENQKSRELQEPDGGEIENTYTVIIECENEQEQQRAYELAESEGFSCRVLTL